MINGSKVDTQFTQNGNTCVLASYGIVGNYFTGESIVDFFSAYCAHFCLPLCQSEAVYDKHFHVYLSIQSLCGYAVICDLHNQSPQSIFTKCRFKFSAQLYGNSIPQIAFFEQTLQREESLLNITYAINVGFHSVTVFHDGNTFMVRDTNNSGSPVTQISGINVLSARGQLRDSVLYTKL